MRIVLSVIALTTAALLWPVAASSQTLPDHVALGLQACPTLSLGAITKIVASHLAEREAPDPGASTRVEVACDETSADIELEIAGLEEPLRRRVALADVAPKAQQRLVAFAIIESIEGGWIELEPSGQPAPETQPKTKTVPLQPRPRLNLVRPPRTQPARETASWVAALAVTTALQDRPVSLAWGGELAVSKRLFGWIEPHLRLLVQQRNARASLGEVDLLALGAVLGVDASFSVDPRWSVHAGGGAKLEYLVMRSFVDGNVSGVEGDSRQFLGVAPLLRFGLRWNLFAFGGFQLQTEIGWMPQVINVLAQDLPAFTRGGPWLHVSPGLYLRF